MDETMINHHSSPKDLGLVFTGLCLHCETCKAVFYRIVEGRVQRVNRKLKIIDNLGNSKPFPNPICPECYGQKIQLWETL